jgi:prevent-host-death family protein
MRIASVADVKAQFSAYLKECRNGPVVVTRNGQPVAALVPILDEDELEDLVLAYSPRFREILGKASRQIAAGEGLSETEFWGDTVAAPPAQAAQ